MKMRNLRSKRIKNYESEEPSNDAYEFCERCGDFAFEYCSIHGGLLVVPDNEVPARLEDSEVPRAILSTPEIFLYIDSSSIPGAGEGVFAKRTLPQGVRFGPYQGQSVKEAATDYCWQILNTEGFPSHMVDASDTTRSNWMRYVNCARHISEQNLVAYQYHGEIYYRTTKIIRLGSEMLVFYGSEFAVKLNIHLGRYNKNVQLMRTDQTGKGTKYPSLEATDTPIEVALKSTSAELQRVAYVMEVININKYFNKESKSPRDDSEDEIDFLSIFKCNDTDRTGNGRIEEGNINKNNVTNDDQQEVLDISNNDSHGPTNATKNIYTEPIFFGPEDQKTDLKNADNETELAKEAKDNDVAKTLWKCGECSKLFTSRIKLRVHSYIHSGTQEFNCGICGYKTHVKKYFRRHEWKIHKIKAIRDVTQPKLTWQCIECQIYFSSRTQLRNHRQLHGLRQLKNEFCDRTDIKSNLEKHAKEMQRSKSLLLKCSICTFSTHATQAFKKHTELHENKKAIKCEICDYLCITQRYLRAHIERAHVSTKLHKCALCASTFKCEDYLSRHMERKHVSTQLHKCALCASTFKCAEYLRKHTSKVHSAKK